MTYTLWLLDNGSLVSGGSPYVLKSDAKAALLRLGAGSVVWDGKRAVNWHPGTLDADRLEIERRLRKKEKA